MSTPSLDRVRNIGIISHIDAGKTTVSERILFYTGEIHKMGEVHEGLAVMDWMDQERERGITITATTTTCSWDGWQINLIDTPGHIDFTIEVERSMRVLDGGVAIFSAVEGVQPQSESVWRQAERYRVPRICFINKMDRIGADHHRVLAQMAERLHARPVLMQLPVGFESAFRGVVDLRTEERVTFADDDLGLTVTRGAAPQELQDDIALWRERLVEAAADFNDDVMAAFLAGEPAPVAAIDAGLRAGVLAGKIFPVFLGSALRNKGIQPLLDGIGRYLPSPLDVPPPTATMPEKEKEKEITLPCDPAEPFVGLAFKVLAEEGRKLTYIRIYSGCLRAGDAILNSSRKKFEKAARLFRMHSHKREQLQVACAGDIVAVAGLKEALTGDTLCAPVRPVVLSGIAAPEPVVSLAVEPRRAEDREALPDALEKLQWEDPTFHVREDEETGQTILTGMGELHLEVIVDRLEREMNVQVRTSPPRVMYRETIARDVTRNEIFRRDIEGKIQAAEVLLHITPGPRGSGRRVVAALEAATAVPAELVTAALESAEAACTGGSGSGYPLTDLQVEIKGIAGESGVTTAAAVRVAAQRGLVMAVRTAEPVLLEPVMALEVVTPEDAAGKVLGALQQKRGRIEGIETWEGMETIRATVPLAELFGYMTQLRSATKGRGTFTMEFSHFDEAPAADNPRW